MRILALRAENIKRLSVVSIEPDGSLVQITGKNGSGKTSCLDALWWAFGGADEIQRVPIRKGHETARVEVSIGDAAGTKLVVERHFTTKKAGGYLKITTPEGFRADAPQQMLEKLIGRLTFDPLDFMRRPAEQFATLRKLVKLDVDIDALDKRRAELFDKRTEAGRFAKQAVGAAAEIVVPDNAPETEPDTKEIVDRLAGVDAFNADIRCKIIGREEKKAELQDWTREFIQAGNEIQRLSDLIVAQENRQREARQHGEALTDEMDAWEPLPELQHAVAIVAELHQAQAKHREWASRQARIAADALVVVRKKVVTDLTAQMDGIDADKASAVAQATLPIEGLSLSFDDGTVLYNGLPLDQASDAQQLLVSVSLAAELNPKLRVMRIRDGSLLDKTSMATLARFAEERDYQVWVEMVTDGEDVGIVIEDGHVKGQEALVEEFEKGEAAAAAEKPAAAAGADTPA